MAIRPRVIAAAVVALLIPAGFALAPPPAPSDAALVDAYARAHAQELEAPALTAAEAPTVSRDTFTATAGIPTLAAHGTNYDFAKMILLFGGWPQTDDAVTAITRWLRQENYVDNWWNRNNPLNNGWGASGGTFMGGYPTLVEAARNAAEAIHTLPGYSGIRQALASGASSGEIENAIWYSSWATGHYAYGAHWSYAPVREVKAPASAWGL
ncbi:MAG: hypothetical protein J0G30_06945 [Actinomycetales bacterium]|nr:hypothetical protein [Actinomycetales bacterium]